MKTDNRGQYMLAYTKEERSKIMSARARERWAKTTKKQRVDYSLKMVKAKKLKHA